MSKNLSPSNLRWSKCAGSLREESVYPYVQSESAKDGEITHSLLEYFLKGGVYDVTTLQDIEKGRAKRIQVALTYILARYHELAATHDLVEIYSESKLDIGKSFKRENWTGKCDVIIKAYKEGVIAFVEVIDYKDGGGYCKIKQNEQLLSYLFACVADLSLNVPCKITIIQPKIESDPIRSEFTNRYDVVNFVEDLAKKAILTDDPNAPLKSGEHCQWCSHKAKCQEIVDTKCNDLDTTEHLMSKIHSDLAKLEGDVVAQLLDVEKTYIDAFTRLKVEASKRLENDEKVGDYFIGKGKTSYKWAFPNDVIETKLKSKKFKKDEIFPSKFLSPAQARKVDMSDAQRKNLEELIVELEGKPQLKKGEPQQIPTEFN